MAWCMHPAQSLNACIIKDIYCIVQNIIINIYILGVKNHVEQWWCSGQLPRLPIQGL